MKLWCLLTAGMMLTGVFGCRTDPAADWREYDPDAQKVLVLADFESGAEIANVPDRGAGNRAKRVANNPYAVWLGVEKARWQANRLEISDEHVLHGKHALKVYANVGSGHAWTPTVVDSFPPDWSDYDAIRFFVHWPEEKKVQWAWFIWLRYTDAEGADPWIQPWLLFDMVQGDHEMEIPLSAFDDLKWKGPVGGCGGGINMTAMKLWGQDKKYEYVHKVGWTFDRVYKMATGLRGRYDPEVPHHYWVDYIRLVKKK